MADDIAAVSAVSVLAADKLPSMDRSPGPPIIDPPRPPAAASAVDADLEDGDNCCAATAEPLLVTGAVATPGIAAKPAIPPSPAPPLAAEALAELGVAVPLMAVVVSINDGAVVVAAVADAIDRACVTPVDTGAPPPTAAGTTAGEWEALATTELRFSTGFGGWVDERKNDAFEKALAVLEPAATASAVEGEEVKGEPIDGDGSGAVGVGDRIATGAGRTLEPLLTLSSAVAVVILSVCADAGAAELLPKAEMGVEVATGREEGAGKDPARWGACDGDNGGLALPAPAPSASGLCIVRVGYRQQGEDIRMDGRTDKRGSRSGKWNG